MSDHDARLEALADLLAAGLSPRDAAEALARAGGGAGGWARALSVSLRGGVDLGHSLARTLPARVAADLGDPRLAGEPATLRFVVARRRARRDRALRLWGALALPGFFVLLTAVSSRALLGLLGGSVAGLAGDLLPLVALVAAVAWGTRVARPRHFVALPLAGDLARRDAEADLAQALAGLDGARPAAAFEVAAALCGPPLAATADATARQLAQGVPLAEAAPTAAAVGEPLALALATGAAAGDLPARMAALATTRRAAVTRALRRLVALTAWALLVWVTVRAGFDLTRLELGDLGGLRGLEGLEGSPELKELMRELDLP